MPIWIRKHSSKASKLTFAASGGVRWSGQLQQTFAFHVVDVGPGRMPRSRFHFVVEFELEFFVVFHVFDRSEDRLVPVTGVLQPLLRRQHGEVGASGFRSD